jgi:hypothetical protein
VAFPSLKENDSAMNTPSGPDPEPSFECDSRRIKGHIDDDYTKPMPELLHEIYRESLNTKQGDGGRIAKTIAKACTLLARISSEQDKVAKLNLRFADRLVIIAVITLFVAVVTAIIAGIDVTKK